MRHRLLRVALGWVFLATLAPPAYAQQCIALQECGDVDASGEVLSSDALRVLKKAVGLPQGLSCDCGVDSENWNWSGTIIGNDPAQAVLVVPAGIQLLLTDVHGTSSAGVGSELRISDDTGLRYVRALNLENVNLKPFDVVLGTALVFDAGTEVTVETTGGTTQLLLSGLLSPAPQCAACRQARLTLPNCTVEPSRGDPPCLARGTLSH